MTTGDDGSYSLGEAGEDAWPENHGNRFLALRLMVKHHLAAAITAFYRGDTGMKRVVPALLAPLMAIAVNAALTAAARADCATEIKAMRAEAMAVKDEHRRRELQKLIDKAAKDDEAGRAQLCAEAMQRARTLLKG
jgi:hypothetical protein